MTPRFSPLESVACVAVRGADAQAFLQAQLSRDISAGDGAPLAGWHDPRGRVRALFRVLRLPDGWLLLTSAALLDTLLPRLRMFVLRAAVTVAPADDLAVGAVLDGDAWLADRRIDPARAAGAVAERDGLHFVRLGASITIVVGRPAQLAALADELDSAPAGAAEVAEIRLGLPAITPATSDRFVAQMLNLDRLGAIAFDKGCYPGQEVITRVHNLGAVKRRMRRYSAAAGSVPAAGAVVTTSDGAAVGEVVRAARTERGERVEILAVVEHAAAAQTLRVAPDLVLSLEPLPYEVPDR